MLKAIPVLLIVLACCSIGCNKGDTVAKPAMIDFSLLTKHKWLITPKHDTGLLAVDRVPFTYIDTVIIKDTALLIFRPDSTFRDFRFATEKWKPGTIPVAFPWSNYFPHGGADYAGVYSLNAADSTLKRTVTLLGITFPSVTYKVLLLTNDSLKLYQASEGQKSYYAW